MASLIIMDYGQKQWSEVLMMDLLLINTQLFTSEDMTGVCMDSSEVFFFQLFGLSFWRHPFTAEDPSDAYPKSLQICSDEETSSSTSWMAWGWVHFKQIFKVFLVKHTFIVWVIPYRCITKDITINDKDLCWYYPKPHFASGIPSFGGHCTHAHRIWTSFCTALMIDWYKPLPCCFPFSHKNPPLQATQYTGHQKQAYCCV